MWDVLKGGLALLIALVFGWLIYLFVIDIREDMIKIDTRVETVDGKVYKCTQAISRDDGMTYIRRVGGKNIRLVIPTKRIKIITENR
jgi:hypothetical protein